MINIDFNSRIYTCPYCGKEQTYSKNNMDSSICNYGVGYAPGCVRAQEIQDCDLQVLHILCSNLKCKRVTVVAVNTKNTKQWDLIPENVCKHYPNYIPLQIRNDYEEASAIINKSPKAAATLLRRCLQGMIRDFWGIKKSKLYDEIGELKDKISVSQWKALDGLRSIGNIGAHMEKDVNLIIDIEPDESIKLQKLIELLFDKWYIARYEEENLYLDIVQVAEEKKEEKGSK